MYKRLKCLKSFNFKKLTVELNKFKFNRWHKFINILMYVAVYWTKVGREINLISAIEGGRRWRWIVIVSVWWRRRRWWRWRWRRSNSVAIWALCTSITESIVSVAVLNGLSSCPGAICIHYSRCGFSDLLPVRPYVARSRYWLSCRAATSERREARRSEWRRLHDSSRSPLHGRAGREIASRKAATKHIAKAAKTSESPAKASAKASAKP